MQTASRRIRLLGLALFWGALGWGSGLLAQQPEADSRLEVDAREIARKLLHARQEIPVRPGRLALWYPKWVPGTHAPGGPVQNLARLRLQTPDGATIAWRRDETEAYRIECTVPDGVERVIVELSYICNQPSINSSGVDSFGSRSVGFLNWNTCLLYPEDASIDQFRIRGRLLLPDGWRYATALESAGADGNAVEFRPQTLREFVDRPLLLGAYLRTFDLQPRNFPPTFLHVAAESPEALALDEKVLAMYRNVASEAGALFGGAHFSSYHWLVTCSDELGYNGVEHLTSSFNAVRERDLIDDTKRKGWVAMLLPHEFVHSWCGKHRRPAGMVTPNFHTPERLGLLWVYEGLAQYLGDILEVRAGLTTPEEYRANLAATVGRLIRTEGRRWRSLEDTAIASHLLRDRSGSWVELRRAQDYYFEGMLLWLEADAVIRQETGGRRSLDDFCRAFMGPQRTERIVPFDRAEVVRALEQTASFDWELFLRERVDVPLDALPLSVLERIGYRLDYSATLSAHLESIDRDRKRISALHSIGLMVGDDGAIQSVIPGMAADAAGVSPGMSIQGVNGRKFTRDLFLTAIADSATRRQLELLVLQGDHYRNFVVHYAEGPKHPELRRDSSRPDLLANILAPKAAGASPAAN